MRWGKAFSYPKCRANATTAFLSFHKSEIGIAFPFKSNTSTVSKIFVVSWLTKPEPASIPIDRITNIQTYIDQLKKKRKKK